MIKNILQTLFLITLVFCQGYSQIPDFSNYELEINASKYKGEFYKLGMHTPHDVLAGLVGEEVYYDDQNCTISNFEITKSAIHKEKLNLNCKASELSIENFPNFQKFFFKKGLDTLNSNLLNANSYVVVASKSGYDLKGKQISYIKGDSVVIDSVFYCKIEPMKFGFCASTSGGKTFQIETEKFSTSELGTVTLIGRNKTFLRIETNRISQHSKVKKEKNSDHTETIMRKLIRRDFPKFSMANGSSVMITFNVCIDRKGYVIDAEIISELPRINDPNLLKKSISSIKKYRWEPDLSAPERECGTYSVRYVDNY